MQSEGDIGCVVGKVVRLVDLGLIGFFTAAGHYDNGFVVGCFAQLLGNVIHIFLLLGRAAIGAGLDAALKEFDDSGAIAMQGDVRAGVFKREGGSTKFGGD